MSSRTLDPSTRLLLRDYGLGFALALLGGFALMGLARISDSFGWSFVLGVPLTMGLVLGYVTGAARGLQVVGVVLLVVAVIGGGIVAGMAGVLCGVVTGIIVLLPTLLGVWLGSRLRNRRGARPEPTLASLILIAACGGLVHLESRIELPQTEETVVTTRILAMKPERAWQLMMFYEEVDLDPPLFARIGLPHPLRTEGEVRGIGDVKRCIYSSGYLTKRITAWEPGRWLGFDVIEQVGIEDRSAELVRGGIRLDGLPDGRTRLTLTTVYRPLLAARLVWRPFERSLAHVLHDHVLDGMELEARRRGPLRLARAARP